MEESGVKQPGAIITGTGLGCIENTEIFLDKLVREGEELLNPTHFMQSTHNTISALVAIDAKCHAYNNTYAHNGISFECALFDAFLQLQTNKIHTALVGAHDEMTPAYFTLLKKAGYVGQVQQTFAGETAVAMLLANEKTGQTLCEIEAVEKMYMGAQEVKALEEIGTPDYIMVGTNGVEENDNVYFENCARLFPGVSLLHYKHIFGENYTTSAFSVYAAALCLQRGKIPEHLLLNVVKEKDVSLPQKIMCYNHFENKNHTFILLSK